MVSGWLVALGCGLLPAATMSLGSAVASGWGRDGTMISPAVKAGVQYLSAGIIIGVVTGEIFPLLTANLTSAWSCVGLVGGFALGVSFNSALARRMEAMSDDDGDEASDANVSDGSFFYLPEYSGDDGVAGRGPADGDARGSGGGSLAADDAAAAAFSLSSSLSSSSAVRISSSPAVQIPTSGGASHEAPGVTTTTTTTTAYGPALLPVPPTTRAARRRPCEDAGGGGPAAARSDTDDEASLEAVLSTLAPSVFAGPPVPPLLDVLQREAKASGDRDVFDHAVHELEVSSS